MASDGEKILKTREKWSEKFGKIDDRFSSLKSVLSDVTFIIGPDKEIAQAHKCVLIACSWKFFIVLSLLKLDDEKLSIPDISYDAFMCFLEYCYTGNVHLRGKDVWSVLKLAYRFNVKQLIEICDDFLMKNLNVSTCIEFYTKDTFLPDKAETRKKIFETIEENFAAIISNETTLKSFLDLPAQKLYKIASSENLKCNEMDLFKGLMKWAQDECRKINLQCYPKNLREVLGEIFHEIRFPIMKVEQIFAIHAYYPKLLTHSEISAIAKFMLKKENHCHGFKNTPRTGYARLKDSIKNSTNTSAIKKSAPKADKVFYVKCFKNDLQLSSAGSRYLYVAFMSELPRKIVGFCYYAYQTNPKLQYCSLNRNSLISWSETAEKAAQDDISRLSSLYCHKVCFQEKQDIIPNQWYSLYCSFDHDIPRLSLNSGFKSYDEISNLHLKICQYHITPSMLIFQ